MSDAAKKARPLIEIAAERVIDRHTIGSTFPANDTLRESYELAIAEFNAVMKDTPLVDLARYVVDATAPSRKFVVPDDALGVGAIIQTSRGRSFGEIVMAGFDAEGSFGYYITGDSAGDWRFVYHKSALMFGVWDKRESVAPSTGG